MSEERPICTACEQQINGDSIYLDFHNGKDQGSVHYCCALTYFAYEIENNTMVNHCFDQKAPDPKAVRKILNETFSLESKNKCSHDWWKSAERRKKEKAREL